MLKPATVMTFIGLVMVGLIGSRSIYLPQQTQVRRLHAEIAEEQATQQLREAAAAKFRQIAQLRNRLPPEPDPSWLVNHLVDLARRSGILLTSIAQQPPQELSTFRRLAVSAQFTASYHELGTFIDAIERAQEFLRVDRLNVTPPNASPQIAVDMEVSTLYVPAPEAKPLSDRGKAAEHP